MRLFGRKGDGQADPQLTGLRFDQVFLMHSYQLTTLGKNICSRTGLGAISFWRLRLGSRDFIYAAPALLLLDFYVFSNSSSRSRHRIFLRNSSPFLVFQNYSASSLAHPEGRNWYYLNDI